jgi:hypothetical protein
MHTAITGLATTTRASTRTAARSPWATGASGARLAMTAVNQIHATGGRYALATMCIGVGQGIAVVLERA